ncbi:MAG: ABC transporter permease subunit [Paracoccus sp. (in: a-proteobacteria)]|nr:ABC transporter permease subunit [Paracoccus sp. (in: a-proteobacteria)]
MELLAFGPTGYGDELARGLGVTLLLAAISYVCAFVLGLALSTMSLSHFWPLRAFWRFYRSVLMAVPSLLVIFFIFFNAPMMMGALLGEAVDISPFYAGIIALSLVYAAYVGEVLRGAFLNVPRGQYEASLALGIRRWPRWRSIILPQALRLALPGLGNIWMVIIKDTALVSLIGLSDIVRQASVAANSTQRPFLFYIVALILFLLVAALSHMSIRKIELKASLAGSSGGERT